MSLGKGNKKLSNRLAWHRLFFFYNHFFSFCSTQHRLPSYHIQIEFQWRKHNNSTTSLNLFLSKRTFISLGEWLTFASSQLHNETLFSCVLWFGFQYSRQMHYCQSCSARYFSPGNWTKLQETKQAGGKLLEGNYQVLRFALLLVNACTFISYICTCTCNAFH